jgi:hypothetical protein
MRQKFTFLTRNAVWVAPVACGTIQVMPTALEERIRELCAKAVAAKDSDQLSAILSELRAALHEVDELARLLIAERTRMLTPRCQ